MRRWHWLVPLLGLLGVARAEVPSLVWQVPQAYARLCTAPLWSRTHTVRVPIPADLRADFASARALLPTPNGVQSLACHALRAGGEVVAIEVRVPLARSDEEEGPSKADFRGQFPIEVYLLAKGTTPVIERRTPVVLAVSTGAAVARPGTGAAFLQYLRRVDPPVFRSELESLASSELFERLPRYLKGRQKLNYQVATLLHGELNRELQLGVLNDRNGAWFVFLDRQPVFSWADAQRDPQGYLVSPRLMLTPGLHRLDLFGILAAEEEIPTLAYRELSEDAQFQRFRSDELWTPNGALALACERVGDVLVPAFACDLVGSYAFPRTATVLDQVRLTQATGNAYGRRLLGQELAVLPEGPTSTERDTLLYLPQQSGLGLRLRARDAHGFSALLETPLDLPWGAPQTIAIDLAPLAVPHLAPADEPVVFDYRLDCPPAFLPRLLHEGRLRLTVRDRQGQEKAVRDEPIPRSPFRRQVQVPRLDADTGSLVYTLVLGQYPVAPPLVLYHVLPGDEPAFGPSAGGLRYRDGYALLARESATAPVPRRTPATLNQLLLVDGFIANGSHVDDNLTLADFLARGAQFQARHLPLYDGSAPDDRPALAKFVQLPTALRGTADTIVWAVGPTELRAGLSLADYRSELAFLAAATLARGKLPLLVSPPIVGDLTQERLRPYALALKEVAAAYDLPVVDFYSASLKRQNIDEYYRVQGRDDLLSATPNAKGREWLLRQVEATLVQYRQERP